MKISNIKKNAGLIFVLAKTSFKLRNEGSYLGVLWYLLNPLIMFLLLLCIFSDRVGHNIPSYPLYLLLGIIMFNFFQQVTFESTILLYNNSGIIKAIRFPAGALVASIVLRGMFSHFFEMIILLIFSLFFKAPVKAVILYPIVLCFLAVFAFGVSLIFFALSAYFRDLNNIWAFILRLVWLGTPIFYAIEGQTRLFFVNLFNPMYYFITVGRDLIVYMRMPEWWMIIGAASYSVLSLVIGIFVFNKLKGRFTEMV